MFLSFRRWLFLLTLTLPLAPVSTAYAQETTPQTFNQYIERGNQMNALSRYDEALADYEQAIKLSPNLALPHLMVGTAHLRKKEYAQAIAAFDRALALDKSEFLAVMQRGKARKALGQEELAAADERDWKQIYAQKPRPKSAVEQESSGDYFRDRNFFGDAVYSYSEALKLDPSRLTLLEKRGDAYASGSQWTNAIADYSRLIEAQPQRIEHYLQRAKLYASSLRAPEAAKDLTEVINRAKAMPDGAALLRDAYPRRATLYLLQGESQKELDDLNEAIKLDPKNAELLRRRGGWHLKKKAWAAAIPDFDQALHIDPQSPWSYQDRAEAYRNLKQPDQAIADYTRAIELNPRYVYAFYRRGLAYEQKADWKQAIASYDGALKIRPKDQDTHFQRGFAYFQLKEWDKTIEDMTIVIELNPKRTQAFINRGAALGLKGDYAASIADYNQAIALNPNSTMAYKGRAEAYRLSGKISESQADKRKVEELALQVPATNSP